MMLVLTLTGYLAGLMHENMFAEGWLLPLTVLAIASLSAEVAYGLILILLGAGGSVLVDVPHQDAARQPSTTRCWRC